MKTIITLIILTAALNINAQQSISLIRGAGGFYNDWGISYSKINETRLGVYGDLKHGQKAGELGQFYKHTTAHIGIVYDWSIPVDPYLAIGLHNEHITADIRKWDLNYPSLAAGFIIGTKRSIIGFQTGFELETGWGLGVNIVFGLVVKF